MMSWYFTDQYTLKEAYTGFQIQLFLGSWSEPSEIKPNSPDDVSILDQARLLREGLAFASTNYETPISKKIPSPVAKVEDQYA